MTTIPRYTFWVCILCINCAVLLTVYFFAASRADPGLRYAALLGASNIATALMATASTLLTGKDLTNRGQHDPSDLPPGGVQTETNTTTVAAPPVAAAVAEAIAPAEPNATAVVPR